MDYNGKEEKKAKGIKKCVVKRKIKFDAYKTYLLTNNPVLRSQEVFKSERHEVYTFRANKIALSSNDDKRYQTWNGITSYPYGTSAREVRKTELLSKYK